MRKASVVILAAASAGTLGAAWVVGTGTDHEDAEVAAPVLTPALPAKGTTTGTATAVPVGPRIVDGTVIDTRCGTVQVQVVILGQSITDVVALKLTDSSETSVAVSNRAAPILREEVLAAQSAAVDVVSSATYTSEAYLTSLQAALDAAAFTR